MASTARTPRVQLVLNLRQDSPMEQVLQVTRGHEVVAARYGGVDFQFSRKRKSEAEAAQPAAANGPAASAHARRASVFRTPAAARALTAATTAAVAAESPYADEVEMPRALGERLLEGLQALPVRAQPADRLLAFCASISSAAVKAAVPRSQARRAAGSAGAGSSSDGGVRAAVLGDALAAFQSSLAAALAEGSVALVGPPRAPATPAEEGEVEQQQPGYQVDLAARKAGLRARLANFQKEEAEWHALLQKVEVLDRQQLLAGGAEEEEAQAQAADAAAAAGVPEADNAAAAEQAAEEGGGLSSVATEPGVYGQAGSQQQEQQQVAEGQGAPTGPGGEEGGDAVLARLHAGVHRHLAMQVEGVCKLVGDVEELLEKANRAAAAVQAEYHAEKFRAFPHVDSPARLIRELVRLPGPPAGGGGGGKAKAAQQAAAAAAGAGDKENAGGPAAMEVA